MRAVIGGLNNEISNKVNQIILDLSLNYVIEIPLSV